MKKNINIIRIVGFFIVLSLSLPLFASPPWVEPFRYHFGGRAMLSPSLLGKSLTMKGCIEIMGMIFKNIDEDYKFTNFTVTYHEDRFRYRLGNFV